MLGRLVQFVVGAVEIGLGQHPLVLFERPHGAREHTAPLDVVGMADPVSGECRLRATDVVDSRPDGVCRWEFFEVVGCPDVRDVSLGFDHEHGTPVAVAGRRISDVDTVGSRHARVSVGEQRHVEVEFLGERPVTVDAVRRHPQDGHVLLHGKEIEFVEVSRPALAGRIKVRRIEHE